MSNDYSDCAGWTKTRRQNVTLFKIGFKSAAEILDEYLIPLQIIISAD